MRNLQNVVGLERLECFKLERSALRCGTPREMSFLEEDPLKPQQVGTLTERIAKLTKALGLLEESLAIVDELEAHAVSGRVSMAVDIAKIELASMQFGANSSVA